MIYKCLIIDDENLARRLIENHLSQLDNFELIASCESAIEASKILQKQDVDLLFLDIEMPVLKGTDFFKNLLKKPKVIFTTAYRDYAIDGFDLNAVDYLLKPITFSRFFKSIEKFIANQNNIKSTETVVSKDVSKKEKFLFIRENRKQVKVFFDEILYIDSLKDYIKIHTNTKTHIIKYSIVVFLENLDDRFIRTHRSYLVNSDKVTAYTKHDIEIGEIEIPIGETYKKNISELFQNKVKS